MTLLAASRTRLLSTAMLWASASVVLALLCFILYGRIEFQVSGLRSRAVDFSYVIILLPLGLVSLVTIWKTFQSLLVALWPGFVGIKFSDDYLSIDYGPFRSGHYESKSLDICYPFELSADEMEGHVEAFLPKQQQYETMLPRMLYAGSNLRVDRLIQKLLRRPDEEIASVMRPMIERWCLHRSNE